MNQEQRRPSRGPVSRGGNLNSTMSIVVAAVAVLLGFLILRDIRSDSGGGSTATPDQATDEAIVTDTIPVETTVVVTVPLTAFKVQIANASKVAGSAGTMTTELQGRGFIVQPAMNSSEVTPKQTATVVYFLPGFEVQAAQVAEQLGGVATAAMPAPIPTETGKLGEASVLILLGTDLAGKPLATPVPTVPVATETTLPPG
jgi:hypothetical protein